jgi:hypothetical protein
MLYFIVVFKCVLDSFLTPTIPVNTHPFDLVSALVVLSHLPLDLQVISSLHIIRLNFCQPISLLWYSSLIIFGEQKSGYIPHNNTTKCIVRSNCDGVGRVMLIVIKMIPSQKQEQKPTDLGDGGAE